MEKTFAIIKPDCLSKGSVGKVISIIEENGLRIIAMKMLLQTREKAEGFYAEHKGKDFFEPLVCFMSSNPCLVLVLEGENAISKWRKIMGKTDPAQAEEGTIRKLYAQDNRHNIVHGSDSSQSAEREIKYFFTDNEIHEWSAKTYKK